MGDISAIGLKYIHMYDIWECQYCLCSFSIALHALCAQSSGHNQTVLFVQGLADSALDHLWKSKSSAVKQES